MKAFKRSTRATVRPNHVDTDRARLQKLKNMASIESSLSTLPDFNKPISTVLAEVTVSAALQLRISREFSACVQAGLI